MSSYFDVHVELCNTHHASRITRMWSRRLNIMCCVYVAVHSLIYSPDFLVLNLLASSRRPSKPRTISSHFNDWIVRLVYVTGLHLVDGRPTLHQGEKNEIR